MSKKEYWKFDVEEWNVLSFTEYLIDRHELTFGIPYVPFHGWGAERGMIADWIGTSKKKGKYSKKIVKDFIDQCFATYTPTEKYPGTSFGFCYTYRQVELQKVIAEEKKAKELEEYIEESLSVDDVIDLL